MNNARIAWGITGAGDKTKDVKDHMEKIRDNYPVNIDVFVSEAGEMVLKMYQIFDDIKGSFNDFSVLIFTLGNFPISKGTLK